MLIEHDARPAQLEWQRDQEQEIGWIAEMDGVDATDAGGEPQRMPERRRILLEIAGGPPGGRAQRVAVDLDAVEHG